MKPGNRDICSITDRRLQKVSAGTARFNRGKPRGTVMVFVMAILGILFIAGVAFLQEVTFQSKTIDADKQYRGTQDLVDSVEGLVLSTMRAGVSGINGIPYNPPAFTLPNNGVVYDISTAIAPDDPSTGGYVPLQSKMYYGYGLILPSFGEVAGVHPLTSQIEPYTSGLIYNAPDYNEKYVYDTRPRLASTTVLYDPGSGTRTPAIAAQPRLDWGLLFDTNQNYDAFWKRWYTPYATSNETEINMDTDGDGIADAAGYRFLPGKCDNAVFRSITASQWEKAFGSEDKTNFSEYAAVGVRVVPHTGFCNLIYSHPWTINYVLTGTPTDDAYYPQSSPYIPNSVKSAQPISYSVEPELRNRNLIPSRNLASASLFADFKIKFGNSAAWNPLTNAMETGNGLRWWPFDPEDSTEVGTYYQKIHANEWLYDGNFEWPYDRRHIVTTTSSDDLFARGVRFPLNHPDETAAGQNVLEWIVANDAAKSGDFWLDDYIRHYGHMQLSLEELEKELEGTGPIWGGTADSNSDGSNLDEIKVIITKTIRDMFWVMLWNHPDMNHLTDFDANFDGYASGYEPSESLNLMVPGDDDWIRAVQAASLAANIIDYMDDDGIPTRLQPFDPFYDSTLIDKYFVYGFERQPFISEVYIKYRIEDDGTCDGNPTPPGGSAVFDESDTQYAIELFNPYNTPLSLENYSLQDLNGIDLSKICMEESNPDPKRLNYDLSNITIPPHSFWTILGYGTDSSSVPNSTEADPFVLNHESRIALKRTVTYSGSDKHITVDQLDLSEDQGSLSDNTKFILYPSGVDRSILDWTKTENQSTTVFASIQRDTSTRNFITANPPLTNGDAWRFTVPFASCVTNENDASLGVDNNTPVGFQISDFTRPVLADTCNSGKFTTAFPTTGSILFVLRKAHMFNGNASPSSFIPFNYANVSGSLLSERLSIDNGHIPVFDPYVDTAAGPIINPAPNVSSTLPEWRLPHHITQAWATDATTPINRFNGQPGGTNQLPWGQLIFDYFTRLPLNSTIPSGSYLQEIAVDSDWVLKGLPYVEDNGQRVHGRLNINAAPWSVLAGTPLMDMSAFIDAQPQSIQDRLTPIIKSGVWETCPAQAVVAYRECRDIYSSCTGNAPFDCTSSYAGRILPPHDPANQVDTNLGDSKVIALPGIRQGKGFLTVGELFNVRHPGLNIDRLNTDRWDNSPYRDVNNLPLMDYRMDRGIVGREQNVSGSFIPQEDYLQAISLMVTSGDWLTTKSNVFTVYGVLADPGDPNDPNAYLDYQPLDETRKETNNRAIRFQSTFDRTAILKDPDAKMDRIGRQIIEQYNGTRAN